MPASRARKQQRPERALFHAHERKSNNDPSELCFTPPPFARFDSIFGLTLSTLPLSARRSLAKWLANNWIKVLGSDDEILNEAITVCVDGKDTYTVKYTDGLEEKKVPAVLINEYGVKPIRAPEPPQHREGSRVQVRFQCHREKARRRLRAQVEKLELIVAKTPVPPNPTWLGAPSAQVVDVMRRCQKESTEVRRKSEAGFQKLLDIWESARTKHTNALRPQLGSPDAKEELEKLVAKEKKRGLEVRAAVNKFKTKLLAMETESAQKTVARLVSVVSGSMTLLDKMVLREDLLPLPGDELILPKRKSLKRLRKAAHGAKAVAAGGEDGGEDGGGAPEVGVGGRKWNRREWESLDLEDMTANMIKCMPPPPELTEEEKAAKEKEKEEREKAKAKAAKGKKGAPVEEEEEEDSEMNAVEKWAKGISEQHFESFVTTAHRCLVKKSGEELMKYSEFYKEGTDKIDEKFTVLEQKEEAWAVKWAGLVDDLTSMNDDA